MSGAPFDCIVVGLGIAGSALAYSLARNGKRVLAFERDLSEPDKIIGELLQPGGVERLRRLGMEECLEGIDSPLIIGYSVFAPGREPMALPYPKSNGERPRGRSFHHGRFIMNLRRKARTAVLEIREATVTRLIEDPVTKRVTGVQWRDKADGRTGESFADIVFVCDGLFSNLRDNFTEASVTHKSKFFGMVLKNAGRDLPFANHGHVLLIKPTPTLIYPISDSGDVRILVDVPEPVPKQEDLKDYFRRVTAPQLPGALKDLFLTALDSETVFRAMPCGKLHSDPVFRPGAMILGDGFNVRHPLTGGGMTGERIGFFSIFFSFFSVLNSKLVAFNDVCLISEGLAKLPSFKDDKAVARAQKRFFSDRKELAAQINILAQALYEVFSNDNLAAACMNYFWLGGEAVDGPMSLLGGLRSSPATLVAHFFAVAFWGSITNVLSAPRILYDATGIIVPLMQGEHLLPMLWRPDNKKQLAKL